MVVVNQVRIFERAGFTRALKNPYIWRATQPIKDRYQFQSGGCVGDGWRWHSQLTDEFRHNPRQPNGIEFLSEQRGTAGLTALAETRGPDLQLHRRHHRYGQQRGLLHPGSF